MTATDDLVTLDLLVANAARVQNALLGFKDNYAADREVASQVLAVHPEVGDASVAARCFVDRAIRYAAGRDGVEQFLDVGVGMPFAGNVHYLPSLARL